MSDLKLTAEIKIMEDDQGYFVELNWRDSEGAIPESDAEDIGIAIAAILKDGRTRL